MRIKYIATIAVLIVSVAICFATTHVIQTAVSHTESFANESLSRFAKGNSKGALESLARLSERWNRRLPLLQMITSHDDLHDISLQTREAATNLKSGDTEEFKRSMSLLQEALDHLREQESVSLSNLF